MPQINMTMNAEDMALAARNESLTGLSMGDLIRWCIATDDGTRRHVLRTAKPKSNSPRNLRRQVYLSERLHEKAQEQASRRGLPVATYARVRGISPPPGDTPRAYERSLVEREEAQYKRRLRALYEELPTCRGLGRETPDRASLRASSVVVFVAPASRATPAALC